VYVRCHGRLAGKELDAVEVGLRKARELQQARTQTETQTIWAWSQLDCSMFGDKASDKAGLSVLHCSSAAKEAENHVRRIGLPMLVPTGGFGHPHK
jgi:hypothetical protein